jgi:hypothetical protein
MNTYNITFTKTKEVPSQKAGRMAQVVECLCSKLKAPSSTFSTTAITPKNEAPRYSCNINTLT